MSNRQFISESDVDKKDNKLTKSFGLYQAVKFVRITTQAAENSAFAKGGELDDIAIESITVDAGANVFAKRVVIAAANLPLKQEYTEGTENSVVDAANLANFCTAYPNVVKVPEGETMVSTIERNLEAAELKVSTNGNLYLNVLPNTVDLNVDAITVKIKTDRGSFVISESNAGLSEINEKAFRCFHLMC